MVYDLDNVRTERFIRNSYQKSTDRSRDTRYDKMYNRHSTINNHKSKVAIAFIKPGFISDGLIGILGSTTSLIGCYQNFK